MNLTFSQICESDKFASTDFKCIHTGGGEYSIIPVSDNKYSINNGVINQVGTYTLKYKPSKKAVHIYNNIKKKGFMDIYQAFNLSIIANNTN